MSSENIRMFNLPNQTPFHGPRLPIYPQTRQLLRASSAAGPVTLGYVQQWDGVSNFRDREQCYLWEPNGLGVNVGGFYRGGLIGNYSGISGALPLFAVGLMCCGTPTSKSSSSSSASPISTSPPSITPISASFSGVQVQCCPNLIPITLFATLSVNDLIGNCQACFGSVGTIPLTYTGGGVWQGNGVTGSGSSCLEPNAPFVLKINCLGDDTWGTDIDITSGPACSIQFSTPIVAQCDPFLLTQTIQAVSGNCCPAPFASITVTVTQ